MGHDTHDSAYSWEPGMSERPSDMDEDAVFSRRAVVQGEVPAVRRRRRSGLKVVVGVICVGCALVTHTFWGEISSTAHGLQPEPVHEMHRHFSNPALPADGKATILAAESSINFKPQSFQQPPKSSKDQYIMIPQGEAWGEIAPGQSLSTLTFNKEIKVDPNAPVVTKIEAKYDVIKASGGQYVTVIGKNFGDGDADIHVRIGSTEALNTIWDSESKLLVKTPPGVGANLDVTVSVEIPMQPVRAMKAEHAFSYSPPYVYDMSPFIVGQPATGPMDVIIHAYGVGLWDTHPEAFINGHVCGKSRWVDNQTVVCSLKEGFRTDLVNPEVKVAGQRSTCGIVVAGVCTVSATHDSVDSIERLEKDMRILKERGADLNDIKKRLQRMQVRKGAWLAKNDESHPCDRFENCYVRSFFDSIMSAILMFMGLGSVLAALLFIRPMGQWIQKEFFEEEEELDDNDPANALALRAREFDARPTLTGL